MSAPRRKPWEVSSGTSSASVNMNNNVTTGTTTSATTAPINDTNNVVGNQSVPERPTSLTSDLSAVSNASPYGSSYGNYGSSRYGTGSGYGGYGSSMYGTGGYGSSMYGGGLGSSMYGGGYGSSMYGGYGSGMYGMGGGYGSGMYGQPGMMAGGPGGLAEGTQATFQLIESIIGAVGGFAQMLEATYMATHSSFFTMVSLAEQFGNLKNALGSLLGIYALINFTKKILYKITGQKYNHGINLKEFSKFEHQQKKLEDNLKRSGGKPRISFKPLLIFLAASIGLPYLLSKAIQKLNEQQQRRSLTQQSQAGNPGSNGINPSSLQFAKATFDFNSENPHIEIDLKAGDLVAILSKLDPLGNESKWWKVRSRLGKIGYVPSNFLAIIERKSTPNQSIPPTPAIPPQASQPSQPAPTTQAKEFVEEFKKLS